jgi:tetratricopeptide (TPR) repeat protein
MGGKSLENGSYAIYTIPGKTEWTVIINKDATLWGTQYNETHDVFRFTVAADKLKESAETFTMQFADFKQESCELHLMWGNTAIRIPITTDVKSLLRPQVEKALGADNVSPNTYMNAASFYYEWDKDLNKALANITKATDANPKGAYLFVLKAKIERDLGDKVSAKTDAQKAISIATEAKNDEYIQMGKDVLNSIK